MTWINNIKLSNILLLVFIVPLVGALIGLGLLVMDLRSEQHTAYRTENALDLSAKLHSLMVAIANERGRSAGFLASSSSNRNNLEQARQAVDSAILDVRNISPKDYPYLRSELINESLKGITEILSNLDEIRAGIDSRSIDTRAFSYYTRANRSLLGSIRYVGTGFADRDIRPLYNLELNIYEVAELFGQIRGLLNGVFIKGQATANEFDTITDLIADELRLMGRIERLAPENLLKPLKEMQNTTQWQEVVNIIQRFQSTQDIDEITGPDNWFSMATNHLSDIEDITDIINNEVHQLASAKLDGARNASVMVASGVTLFVVLSVTLIITIRRTLARRVTAIKRVMVQASEHKDMSGRLNDPARDELGDISTSLDSHFGAMAQALFDINQQVGITEEQLSVISQAAENAVHNAQAQHEKTDQIATAMAEMTQTSEEIAKNMQECAQETTGLASDSKESRNTIRQTQQSMEQLDGDIEQSSQIVTRLAEDAKAIAGILASIEAIAEQTNLLALNAAIEAARAGEQGRGFAVVAEEVRNLAQRTQDSTQEINAIVERLGTSSDNAIDSMSRSKAMTETTAEAVSQTQVRFEALFQSIERIEGFISQVATAAEEQTQVSEEINHNVQNVSSLSDKTLSDIEKSSSAVDSMSSSFSQMKSRINEFNIN